MGGTFHLKLSIASSPIAYKYREGKVQSTLKRGLNVPEIAAMQAYGACFISAGLGATGGRSLWNDWPVVQTGIRNPLSRLTSFGYCQHE